MYHLKPKSCNFFARVNFESTFLFVELSKNGMTAVSTTAENKFSIIFDKFLPVCLKSGYC